MRLTRDGVSAVLPRQNRPTQGGVPDAAESGVNGQDDPAADVPPADAPSATTTNTDKE